MRGQWPGEWIGSCDVRGDGPGDDDTASGLSQNVGFAS